jgi:hypothetical protein
MTLTALHKTPFPWWGGKSDAAEAVWAAIGDTPHYVEPFAGSLAVLLRRPHPANRTYYSETVNDADGLLCNAWRGIQLSPDATAEAASWPVAEADLHARHVRLVRWRAECDLERLMGDPAWHDPVMAGWWLWGLSSWIGSGWCSGTGPWSVDDAGRFRKVGGEGVKRQRPHLGDNGQGVNRPGTREPGVARQFPHLGDDGKGVNRPQAREPGVARQLPHLSGAGQGVNHPGTREPGVGEEADYHPMTMPELRRWMRFLSARLRHVRILNGDWTRAVTTGATKSLAVRTGGGPAGVFLDPPYGDVRAADLYSTDSLTVATDVQAWCRANGDDPQYRIVLAGFDDEHATLAEVGWTAVEWFKTGFLKGGMGNIGKAHQQHRERLWLSPHCLRDTDAQMALL